MADFSIIQKLKLALNAAVSTPFFIIYAVFGLILVFLIIFDLKKHKKISKIIYIVSLIFLFTFFTIKYFSVLVKILDSVVEIFVKTIFFPSLGIYIAMLIMTNITMILVILSRNRHKIEKTITVIISILINILFVIIINLITVNKIDISSDVKLYSDTNILTLLQLSMSLFISLYLLIFLFRFKYKMRLYDKNIIFDNEIYPDMPSYIQNNNIGVIPNKDIKIVKIIDFSKDNR